jgi:hypothetical protein
MKTNGRLDGAGSVGPMDPRATGAGPATRANTASGGTASVVCYCGLYDECPHWHEMTDDERRACSADKRMILQQFWKNRIVEA